MPELPEVEYTRQRLSAWLDRGRVVECQIHDPRLVRPTRAKAATKALLGRTVKRVERRGKWLRLVLDGDVFTSGEHGACPPSVVLHGLRPARPGLRPFRFVFVHLAMTGWFEHPPTEEKLRHERARITVQRGKKKTHVAYVDARRWGRWVVSQVDIPAWTALGPDPLHEKLDPVALHAKLARRKKLSIKEALLDQRFIAGVGNIQAAEALWKAQIDPRAIAASIDLKNVRAIVRAIGWTIDRTLKDLAKGDEGEDDPWIVYGHKGQPCPRCGAILVRIELGGRTTTFCPGCQKGFAP